MELNTVLQYINEATGVLIQYFHEEGVQYYGAHPFEPNPSNLIIKNALAIGCSLGVSLSPEFIFTGFVRIKDSQAYLVIGPMLASECSRKQAQRILSSMHQPENKIDALLEWLTTIPQVNHHRLVGILKLIHLSVNDTVSQEIVNIPYSNELDPTVSISNEPEFIEHFSPELERALLSSIEHGNVAELEKIVTSFEHMGSATFDPNTKLLQDRIFMASVTLSSRAAIQGGLDYNVALAMNDKYIETMERLNNTADILLLLKKMFLDFAKKVARANELPANSILVKQITKEIHAHLYEKITPTLIAEHLNMNCSYLCNHFKKETGKTITEYINQLKINESKRLLKNTQLSLIQISTQLGFSSQSYFHIVFKKQTGMTPNDYRNRA